MTSVLAVVIILSCILVPKYDSYNFRKIAAHTFASYFKPAKNDEVIKIQEDLGFMRGVCHAHLNTVENAEAKISQMTDANISWTRIDISWLPYEKDENGNIIKNVDGTVKYTEEYSAFRQRCQFYADHGVKVLAVTPYPKLYYAEEYENNINVTELSEEKKSLMREHAKFYATDLKGLVQAIQISNELGHSHFMRPLASLNLSAEYISVFLEAMHPILQANGMVIGFNVELLSAYNLTKLLKPYMEYVDYIGIDLYFGCFESYIRDFYMFQAVSRSVFNYTGKPIVMAEFGYIGSGEAKSETERNAVLQKYGYANIDAVKADVAGFVQAFGDANYELDENGNKCDSTLVKEAKARLYDDDGNLVGEQETFEYLFNSDKSCHIYEELPKNYYLKGYPHTEQGQADFYKDVIPYLYDLNLSSGYSYIITPRAILAICASRQNARWKPLGNLSMKNINRS